MAQKTSIPALPLRTPLIDENGNITRPWIAYLQGWNETGDAEGGVGGGPGQPTDADWTVSVVEDGYDDQAGVALARLEAIVTARPEGTLYFSIYTYEGADPPAEPSAWGDSTVNTRMSAAGDTVITWWVQRQSAAVDLQLALVANSATVTVYPDATASVKEITIDPPAAPAQVTGFSVSVITGDPGGIPSGKLVITFTPPADVQWFCINLDKIRCDSSYVPLVGEDWLPAGSLAVSPYEQTEWWPRDDSDEYWKFRAQSTSRAGLRNTTSSPTDNVFVPASTGVAGGSPPAQPGASDWSVSVAEYGRRDQTGENIARVAAVATTLASNVTYISMFVAEGVSKPTNPSAYKDMGVNEPKAASGSTTANWWATRRDAAVTYWVILAASSETYQSFPTSAHVAIAKSVTVNPVSVPAQPTGFSVTVLSESKGGVPGGRLKYTLTKPADPEYFCTEFERIRCNSSFTPLGGEVWNLVGSAVETVEAPDWWARPSAVEYWQFRATAVSRAFYADGTRVKNLTSRPTSNLTVSATGGLDLSYATTASVQGVLNNLGNYPTDKRPVVVASGLPSLPDSNYPTGALLFNTTDGKMYRNVSGTWTKTTDPADLVAGTLAAGVVYAGTVYASQLNLTSGSNVSAMTAGYLQCTNGITSGNYASTFFNIANGTGNQVNAQTDRLQVFSGYTAYCTMLANGSTGSYVDTRNYTIAGTTVIDYNRYAYLAKLNISGFGDVINTSGQFIGAGLYTLSYGAAAAGFNPYVGGTQYYGVASDTFTTVDGKTATVKGGVIVSLV